MKKHTQGCSTGRTLAIVFITLTINIPTVNILNGGPSGVYAEFCTEDMYVSGSKVSDIVLASGEETVESKANKAVAAAPAETSKGKDAESGNDKKGGATGVMTKIIQSVGRVIGAIVNAFFTGAKQAVNMTITSILLFLIFLSFMGGLLTTSGFGTFIANLLTPLVGSVVGLIIFALVIGIPVLSPCLSRFMRNNETGGKTREVYRTARPKHQKDFSAYETVSLYLGNDHLYNRFEVR